jgi:uncharacterized phage protein gp47/JayE
MNDRFFPIKARGDFREAMLRNYRYGLRSLINEQTGQPFTEDEITRATQKGSEIWLDYDGLDAVLLLQQQRSVYVSAQIPLGRASTSSLQNLHGPLWGESFLPAAGGSGPVNAPANPGTIFFGTTKIGDPTAIVARDQSGKRYQVLFTTTTPAEGVALLTMAGIDTGDETNLEPGTKLAWVNAPVGASGPPEVVAKFRGGIAAENDAQFAARLGRRIRHKQGAGNRSQIRAWAEDSANNAVESAFAYSCVLHAGSMIVAIVQKRGSIKGPAGRIASAGTLAAVTAYLAPPGSAVVPGHPRIVVLPCVAVPTNMTIGLSMAQGTTAGWSDFQPWPTVSATITAINVGGDPLAIRVTTAGALPQGVTAPKLMVWDVPTSRFEELIIASAALQSGTTYDVILSSAPTHTLAVGDYVSPLSARRTLIDKTIEAYCDSLGPGELIDVSASSSDGRRARAYRFPKPNEEYPMRAGTTVLSFLQDALGTSLVDSVLQAISVSVPPLPADPILGPGLIVAGKVGIYPV